MAKLSRNDQRFWFGVTVTVLWLLFTAFIVNNAKSLPTELNEWGDFCAGFFSPLAFLWLVLGYLQQGEELQHSTRALLLQAEELKNSVEQQSQLVAVSKEQVQHEREALAREAERNREAGLPLLMPQSGTITRSGGMTRYSCSLVNLRGTASAITLNCHPQIVQPSRIYRELLIKDQVVAFEVVFSVQKKTTVTVTYTDSFGQPGAITFAMEENSDGIQFGPVQRTI